MLATLNLVKGVYDVTVYKVYREIVTICVYASLVVSCADATGLVVVNKNID